MSHFTRAKRTGGAWAAGLGALGFIGLLATTAIIIIEFSKETDAVFTPGTGTIPAKQQAEKLVGTINQRNADVDRRIKQEASQGTSATPVAAPAATAAPATRPAATPAAVAVPAPAGGAPSGGQVIGPISPVSPIAPIQEGSGANFKPAKNTANGVNDAINDRNKELEKAIENGGN